MIVLIKILRPFSVIMLLLALFSFSALADNEPQRAIMLSSQHPVYQLVLASNPTTGYRWYLKSYDNRFLSLIKHSYQKARSRDDSDHTGGLQAGSNVDSKVDAKVESKLVGMGGQDKWVFRANSSAFRAPMLLVVQLVYARPWDINHGQEKTVYFVTN